MTEQLPPAPLTRASRNARPRAVIQNILTGYATLGIGLIVGLFTTPALLHALGNSRFGVISLLVATTAYLGLLEAGLGVASINRIASLEATNSNELPVIANTTTALYRVIGLAALILTAVLAPLFPRLFTVPHAFHTQASVAFALYGAAAALSSMSTAYTAILLGTGRSHIATTIGFATSTLTTLVTVAVAIAWDNLVLIGAVQLIGAVVTWGVMRAYTHRIMPTLASPSTRADWGQARALITSGWPNGVTSLVSTLAFGSDLVLVGLLLNLRDVATYAIAQRAGAFLVRIGTTAAQTLNPSHADRAAAATPAQRFDLYCVAVLLVFAPAVAIFIPIAFYGTGVLDLWIGHVPPVTARILTINCLALVFQAPAVPAFGLLQAADRGRRVMLVSVLSAVCNVAVSIAATAAIGIQGPMLGSLAAIAFVDATVLPIQVCRMLAESYWSMVLRTIRPLLIPAAVLAALCAAGHALDARGAVILPMIGVAELAYAALLWRTPTLHGLRAQVAAST